MALMDFSIDTSGSPQDVQRRQALADALMKQGTDSTPAAGGPNGGWLTALNRGLAGALGGYQRGQAQQEEQQGRSSAQQMMAQALQGGKIDPQTYIQAASNPWSSPAQIGALGKVQDWQHQTEQDAEHKREFGMSYGLQKDAAARAAQAAERANMTEEERAAEREKAAAHYGLIPGSPGYQPFVLTGKLPDPNKDVPNSVGEYQFYTNNFKPTPEQPQPMDYATFSTAKARAGATNISNNVDMNSGQTYDKQLAEGLGKSHAALANGVEDAQSRARDIAAMQGAVDAIQKNGGTTGGLAPAARLELQKSVNAGANALGIDKPFNEGDFPTRSF
jgi:hypothetical protein